MKIKFLFLLVILSPVRNFAQDTVMAWNNRTFFSLQAGGFYKTFIGNKYIEHMDEEEFVEDSFEEDQYEGYSKIPTWGYNLELLFTYKFREQFRITTGLSYFMRKDVYTISSDSISSYTYQNIHSVLEYDYSFHDLEIPIMFQYSKNKFNYSLGSYVAIISYSNTDYTYLISNYPNPGNSTSTKKMPTLEIPLRVFLTAQVNYELSIGKKSFSPYTGFDYALNNQEDLFIKVGVNYRLGK